MSRSRTPPPGSISSRARTSSTWSSRATPPRSGPTSPQPTSAPRQRSSSTRRWSARRRSRRPFRAGAPRSPDNFTADSARELANVLKYGSLPLSFESSEAETVSATLGLASLRAGLIAGAVGLAAVLLYSLLYYRVLGLLVALSLVASGAMVFAILVLLGRYINYTLDLAGIAGLIIGIGMTADSFVVFFERIKDEIREGRSFRSAVPRGWARARKTIMSGNAVTLPGRRGAVLPGRGPGEGLCVHPGPDHDPRHRDRVPGDVAAGLHRVEVADHGQAGAERAGSCPADRPRTPSGGRPRRDGGSTWRQDADRTEPTTSDAVEALDLEAAAADAPRHGFFVRLYTGTGAFDVDGPAQALVRHQRRHRRHRARSILLRGFTFGIDFEGGTKVSMPRGDGQTTTQQVEQVFTETIGTCARVGGRRRHRCHGDRSRSARRR